MFQPRLQFFWIQCEQWADLNTGSGCRVGMDRVAPGGMGVGVALPVLSTVAGIDSTIRMADRATMPTKPSVV